MSKKNRNRRLNPQNTKIGRKAKSREERSVREELPLMMFSFKDFQYNNQIPPGQSYAEWEENKLLSYMLEKFGYICNVNRIEAVQQNFIKVYGKFPVTSNFQNPFPESELQWAVVMKISGQKGRIAGYIVGNIFYVVFLDSEHLFFPSIR